MEEYDRMIQSGVFDQTTRRRLEFIKGEIREMTPIGSLHEVVVDRLTEWSLRNLPEGQVWVRVQNSIGLPELQSAPELDLAWVARRDYSESRPSGADVLLIVEVAHSSLGYDRGEKAELYAAAGINDYWVVNLRDGRLEVHRDPAGGKYRTVRPFTGNEEVRPLAMPEMLLRTEDLLQE